MYNFLPATCCAISAFKVSLQNLVTTQIQCSHSSCSFGRIVCQSGFICCWCFQVGILSVQSRKALGPAILQCLICPHCCCVLAGNNAVEMQTTAEFDQDADEFIITTPTTLAQKYWVCHPLYSSHSVAVSPSDIILRTCSNAASSQPYRACQHSDVYKSSDRAGRMVE